jgi:hypothetical protein
MTESVETILAAVEGLPGVTVESGGAQEPADVRVGARIVARIDHRGSRVLVDVPPEWIPTLRQRFPSSRATVDGVVFDVAGPEALEEALAAIRSRIHVERFVPQLRAASP